MMAWTDERMDDLSAQMAAGFGRLDDENRELRQAIVDVRTELKGDIVELRAELKGDIADLRAELKGDIKALHEMMFRFCIASFLCLGGLVATLVGVLLAGPASG